MRHERHDPPDRPRDPPRHREAPSPRGGHLRGVIAMIEEGRPCLDLAQQLHTIERAVAEAKRTLIQDHLNHCFDAATDGPAATRREAVAEFRAIAKFL